MTIKELKEVLSKYPDNFEVVLQNLSSTYDWWAPLIFNGASLENQAFYLLKDS